MAEKETIKSAFFIGYVVMQVDYDDVVMQKIQVISSNAIYDDVILKVIINLSIINSVLNSISTPSKMLYLARQFYLTLTINTNLLLKMKLT